VPRALFCRLPRLDRRPGYAASLRGTQSVLLDMIDRPEELERQLQKITTSGSRCLNGFTKKSTSTRNGILLLLLWAPGRMSKLQSDISGMISPKNFAVSCCPISASSARNWTIRCTTLMCGCSASPGRLAGDQELNAIQWTPGVGQRRVATRRWYSLLQAHPAAGNRSCPAW